MVDAGIFPGSIAAILGLMIGSFLNVIIYRMPRNESIVFPGSHCTSCNTPIKWYHNIPGFSYFILGGKCANCKSKFSIRYPFIEGLTGALCFWGFYHYSFYEAMLFIVVVSSLIVISFIDIDYMIIPLLFILISGGAIITYNFIVTDQCTHSMWGIITGICYLGGVSLLTKGMFKKETMGMGDLQLIAVLGAWLGPVNTAATIFAGSLTTLAAFGIVLLISGKKENRALPFGPFLAFSGIAFYMIDPDWYAILLLLN